MPKKLFFIYQLYAIVASTIIFLVNLLLLSGPVRTANLIIITPLVALAWINFTNPQKTTESIWTLRMLIVVFCLTVLGLITFELQTPLGPAPAALPSPVAASSPSPALNPSPTATPAANYIMGAVTITNPLGASLYFEPNLNSQSNQTVPPQLTYPYLDFHDGFFEILLDSTSSGWVKLDDVIPGLDNIKIGQ